jgi:GNAT superfamily N-acetyltransferase
MTELVVKPLTRSRWDDLVVLFGDRGAYSGCWCMWFRVTSKQFSDNGNRGNRRALTTLVERGRRPGLLGYLDGSPVGWVSVAPRHEFGRIERSPVLARVDDEDVWSIVCFYIDRRHRRNGVASELLRAAIAYATGKGARTIEGYPIDASKRKSIASAELFVGTSEMFARAGFREVARRSPTRPIMRYRA